MPTSARKILAVLDKPLSQKEIIKATGLPARTIRFALSLLKTKNLIRETKSLSDMREVIYSLTYPCF